MAVVLPAPLGPRRPNTVPSRATMSIPPRARTLPNVFTRPSASIADVVMVLPSILRWPSRPCAADTRSGGQSPAAALVQQGDRLVDASLPRLGRLGSLD